MTDYLVEKAKAALESQRMFEALFDHDPKVDTRTPAQVAEDYRS